MVKMMSTVQRVKTWFEVVTILQSLPERQKKSRIQIEATSDGFQVATDDLPQQRSHTPKVGGVGLHDLAW